MLEGLFAPKSVAVIGASKSPGKVGNRILSNLLESGYEGTIVPVNPTADEIMGLPCYASLEAYGKPVELCVIVIPRPQVLQAVDICIAAGAKAPRARPWSGNWPRAAGRGVCTCWGPIAWAC